MKIYILVIIFFLGCGSEDTIETEVDNNTTIVVDTIETEVDNNDITVLFSSELIAEWSIVQPYPDWFLSKNEEIQTLNEIYSNGGSIKQIIKLNSLANDKQFWIIMEERK